MLLNSLRSPCSPADRDLIGRSHTAHVHSLLSLLPGHRATPLPSLPAVAAQLDLASVHLKAEGNRMGLSSFKALGGGYAIVVKVLACAETTLGRSLRPQEMRSGFVRSLLMRSGSNALTVICASAGNHGLSVAAAAQVFGVRAVVCLSDAVPERFAIQLRKLGAMVMRGGASYEESMAFAAAQAALHGWDLLSDSSWPGYTTVPIDVMRGYTVLLEEAAELMDRTSGQATHVFVQAGVGGLAAAAVAYLRDRWGESFKFIVVEAEGAPCLLESIREQRLVRVAGSPTRLGRLDCKQPSLLAFDLLSRLADGFMLVSDAQTEAAARRLLREGVSLSACGSAGFAGLAAVCADDSARQLLDLDASSQVLVIGTEAAPMENVQGFCAPRIASFRRARTRRQRPPSQVSLN